MIFFPSICLFLLTAALSVRALPIAADSTSTLVARYTPNAAEIRYCIWPPNVNFCFRAYAHGDEAINAARNSFPANTLHNGKGDAFRHCYWCARMTIDMGKDVAKIFGDLHEEGDDNPAAERDMDLTNNATGRQYGEEAKRGGGSDGDKYARAFTKCKNEADLGHLRVIL
ncbi:hypothetical protein L873DRAFT_1799943 [Choiromyces venosus 120613-1]|uniref:DUF6973 domain-containing protein n=1 Tax=Choiromyces venosus 120613-1 TaxID=1336337 RepID=A0A3N4K442_9PEZI|nr:hypothetical protein L873DRAFT_1799943 [Choiromyces venosus 120613-1]